MDGVILYLSLFSRMLYVSRQLLVRILCEGSHWCRGGSAVLIKAYSPSYSVFDNSIVFTCLITSPDCLPYT